MESFLGLYKRLPNRQELEDELEFHSHAIRKHGGLRKIKEAMNYENKPHLVDQQGDCNYFYSEWMTANFLIEQHVSYKRKQLLFSTDESSFRSDFTFYPIHKSPLHVELWTYSKDDESEAGVYYNQKRKEKEALYEVSGVSYLSIEKEVFQQLSEEKVKNALYQLFAPYLSFQMEEVEHVSINSSEKMTDEEMVEIIMAYSDDKEYFPSIYVVRQHERAVYKEIIKRHKNFRLFADKFHKKMVSSSTYYWTSEKVEERFVYMITTYQRICSEEELRKTEDYYLKGLYKAIYKYGGNTYHRLKCYQTCLKNNIRLPEREINYIRSKRIRGDLSMDTPIEKIVETALEKHTSQTINV
jgi:hypothetical protein